MYGYTQLIHAAGQRKAAILESTYIPVKTKFKKNNKMKTCLLIEPQPEVLLGGGGSEELGATHISVHNRTQPEIQFI